MPEIEQRDDDQDNIARIPRMKPRFWAHFSGSELKFSSLRGSNGAAMGDPTGEADKGVMCPISVIRQAEYYGSVEVESRHSFSYRRLIQT
jgi:hypothetical protein